MTDVRLSTHFTLSEMLRSQTALRYGINNVPTDAAVNELRRLCATLLEPARLLLGGRWMHTDSGYRCPALNARVNGSPTSAHMFGRAADEIPVGLSLQTAFDILRRSTLPYDQIIIECGAWLHLGIAEVGVEPRREAMTGAMVLKADGSFDHWVYTTVTA
jgi:zinc D-Ala-D-Ala carboxypeptidase